MKWLKSKLVDNRASLTRLLLSILFAFSIATILLLFAGQNPIEIYQLLFYGAFGNIENITRTLVQSTPIITAGLAACIAFKSGVFNIGIEGQLYMGGFAAALVGFSFELPAFIHLPLAILASILAGILWILIPAFFRAKYNTNEVVATILMNYVAVLLTSYFTIYLFKRPGGWSETPKIFSTAKLMRIFSFSRLNVGFFIALFLAFAVYFYLKRTSSGYETIITGSNQQFAEYGGVNINKKVLYIMFASGAIAGLAGGIETLGVHHRFMQGFAPEFGFDGLIAALLASSNPIGTIFTALFFGSLRSGSLLLEVETPLSREFITVLQSILILFISAKLISTKEGGK